MKKDWLVIPKTGLDLNSNFKVNNQLTPSINKIVEILLSRIDKFDNTLNQVIHGDLCLSNILSFRNQTIKIIDPRGHDHNGKNTI